MLKKIWLISGFAGLVLMSLVFYWYFSFVEARKVHLPDLERLKNSYPVVQYQGPKQPFSYTLETTRPKGWRGLHELPERAVGAIVISEDWAFFDHSGFDWRQMREALTVDLKRGKFARGASTITQQVVKNLFLTHEKSVVRKALELVLAIQLDEFLSKERILEIYLNIAEWGEGIFGIEQASQMYFAKPATQLSPREGAFLAMLLPSPKRYSQSFRDHALSPYASRTIYAILGKLLQAGIISDDEHNEALQSRFSFETVNSLTNGEADGDTDRGNEE